MDHPDITADEASDEAAHKAKSAAFAVEVSRELHQKELVAQTKDAMIDALREIFGDGDKAASGEMNILIRRIPFICDDIVQMHKGIDRISSDLAWMKWIGSGFVVAAGMLALKSIGL